MKKLFFCLMVLSIIFPVLTWGEDNSGDNEYIPRTVATGDISALKDEYGDIVRYRYNPVGEHWKLRTNKCAIKYNPMEDEWSYAYPGEVLRYNPEDDDWDYAFPETQLRYDIFQEKWWYGYVPPQKEQDRKTLTTTSPLPQ